VVAVLAVGGCGGSSSTDGETSSSTVSASPPAHVSVGTVETKAPGAVLSNHFGKAKGTWVKIDKTRPVLSRKKEAVPTTLVVKELEPGSGPKAEYGDELTIMYASRFLPSGEPFTASWDWGEPTTFVLGEGLLDSGWETGLDGMQVGGRRELIVPAGFRGHSGFPPDETLNYVVDLFAIRR
jgi:peptidylprolyl isomerase